MNIRNGITGSEQSVLTVVFKKDLFLGLLHTLKGRLVFIVKPLCEIFRIAGRPVIRAGVTAPVRHDNGTVVPEGAPAFLNRWKNVHVETNAVPLSVIQGPAALAFIIKHLHIGAMRLQVIADLMFYCFRSGGFFFMFQTTDNIDVIISVFAVFIGPYLSSEFEGTLQVNFRLISRAIVFTIQQVGFHGFEALHGLFVFRWRYVQLLSRFSEGLFPCGDPIHPQSLHFV